MKLSRSLQALLLGLICPAVVTAQGLSRNDPRIIGLFAEVNERASKSTVRVRCDGKDSALGAVVAEGLVLTKASELRGNRIVCVTHEGQQLEAVRIGTDERFDVVLLRVDGKGLSPIEWAESKIARPGRWLASASPGKQPVAIGVVSVATRNLTGAGAVTPSPTSGYLGAGLDTDFGGVKINQISPGSPAQRAGLKENDQVLAVNGEAVNTADEFLAIVLRSKPGDNLKLKVVRNEKEMEVRVSLGQRPKSTRQDTQNSWGSQLSDRRTGFPTILQHDTILRPADCGGPVIDVEGKAVGLNIARAGRTESYAIPGEVVREIVEKLKKTKL